MNKKLKKRIKVLFVSIAILITLINVYFINQIVEAKESTKYVSRNEEVVETQQETAKKEEENLINTLKEEKEPAIDETYETEEVDTYSFIINEANADQEFVDELVRQINLVPKDIVNSFATKKCTIHITNEDLHNKLVKNEKYYEENLDSAMIWGLLLITDDIMYIYNDESVLREYVVIHEFGHYADKVYGWPSYDEKFKPIYAKEKEKIDTISLKRNEQELYAEAFKMIIIGRYDESLEVYKYVKDSMQIKK